MFMEGKGRKWMGRKSLDHGRLSHHQVPSWKRLFSSIQTATVSGEEMPGAFVKQCIVGTTLISVHRGLLVLLFLCKYNNLSMFSPLPCDECQLFEGFAIPQMLRVNYPWAFINNCWWQ